VAQPSLLLLDLLAATRSVAANLWFYRRSWNQAKS